MKAVLIDEFVRKFSDLRVQNLATPARKRADDVVVRITHAAITHVDMLYAQGKHQNNQRHVKPPFILGNEFSGIIHTAPPNSSFRPGDRVAGQTLGSYAEYICVDSATLTRTLSQWTNAQSCAVGASGAICWGSFQRAGLRAGETVLVLGASGGLGVMAVQIAKARDCQVIALAGSGEKGSKARMLREIGADEVVDYAAGNEKWEEIVKDLTSGRQGVDVVFDAIGEVEKSLRCLRYRGRIVVVGFAAREGKMERLGMNRVLLKGAAVYGYRFGEDARREPQSAAECWRGFNELVEKGKIRPVVYDEKFQGLEALPRAMRALEAHEVWGRAVLSICEDAETASTSKL